MSSLWCTPATSVFKTSIGTLPMICSISIYNIVIIELNYYMCSFIVVKVTCVDKGVNNRAFLV